MIIAQIRNQKKKKKKKNFKHGNDFGSHLQGESQDPSTLTQLTIGPTRYVNHTRDGHQLKCLKCSFCLLQLRMFQKKKWLGH